MEKLTRWQRMLPASPRLAFFPTKPIKIPDKWTLLRRVGQSIPLSTKAQLRLEWIIFYFTVGKKNVTKTASHFGISRKTFHKWLKRFDERRLETLEELSRAPHQRRIWLVTPEEEIRIIKLRKKHLRLGKMKLKILYQRRYQEKISSWKIQRVIERHQLYHHPLKAARLRRKRKLSLRKKRITQLTKKNQLGFLFHLDTVVLYWEGVRRYIFAALDEISKIGYARMYTTASSRSATDFLKRLHYLLDGQIENIHTDNGSEFLKDFTRALKNFKINHYFSRTHTPQDNASLERFNRTLQEEFMETQAPPEDIKEFNQQLTEWLIFYNFERPHQTLDYQTPIEYAQQQKVLPMSPSSTVF